MQVSTIECDSSRTSNECGKLYNTITVLLLEIVSFRLNTKKKWQRFFCISYKCPVCHEISAIILNIAG